MRRTIRLAGALTMALPALATAQTMRSFTATRATQAERLLRARLDFSGGQLDIAAGPTAELYRAQIRYDADRFVPVQRYDARTGVLNLGLQIVGSGGVRVTSRAQLTQVARFTFSPAIPLDLDLSLSAGDGTIDLGGLNLVDLAVRTSASRSTVTFSTPATGICRAASFSMAAGQLMVTRLAQSGCATLTVDGSAGSAILDFTGTWRRNMTLAVDVSMGTLVLRLPRGTGVQLGADRFLSPMAIKGLTRQGDRYVTADFANAEHKLTVELKTSIASVSVEWVD